MNIFQAIILAIVEGITEFLPISSTGHLTLATHLLGLQQTEFVKSFIIIIQLGAIAAVAVLYFKRLIKDFESWKKIIAAFIPSGVIGLILYEIVKKFFLGNEYIVVASLFLGGLVLIWFDKYIKNHQPTTDLQTISYKKSGFIGLFQAIAMIPGVSRSAATIIGGVTQGLSKKDAVEFSFFLAIPTMLAATVLDLDKVGSSFSSNEFMLLAVGTLGSFIVAIAAIKGFLSYVQTKGFAVFGYYRILIALLYFAIFLWK